MKICGHDNRIKFAQSEFHSLFGNINVVKNCNVITVNVGDKFQYGSLISKVTSISNKKMEFSWKEIPKTDEITTSILTDINLNLKKGDFVTVVG